MFEPTRRGVDQALESSKELFERAHVGEAPAISPRSPCRLLVALDGSKQDETSVRIARYLTERFNAPLALVDARQEHDARDLAAQRAAALGEGVEALARRPGENFEQVLRGIAESGCELLIVPCPFGRELEKVGPDSTGTVIDVLLARSPVPLVVVRHAADPAQAFSRLLLPLAGSSPAAGKAAAWAVGLAAPRASLRLVLVLQDEFYHDLQAVLRVLDLAEGLSPEVVAGALAQAQGRLHRGLQKACAAAGFDYQMRIVREGDGELQEALARTDLVTVLPLERADSHAQGHVSERIRHLSGPVLVVPG